MSLCLRGVFNFEYTFFIGRVFLLIQKNSQLFMKVASSRQLPSAKIQSKAEKLVRSKVRTENTIFLLAANESGKDK